MTGYSIEREDWLEVCDELEPLYRAHYAEMCERLARDGLQRGPLDLMKSVYDAGAREKRFAVWVARQDGRIAGYMMVWLTSDVFDRTYQAREEAVFVLPEHRRGLGRRIVRRVMDDLREMGVKRLAVASTTDFRVAKMYSRMGFKPFTIIQVAEL